MLTPKEAGANRVAPTICAHSALFDGMADGLSRTFATAGNTRQGTIAFWVKKADAAVVDTNPHLVSAESGPGFTRFVLPWSGYEERFELRHRLTDGATLYCHCWSFAMADETGHSHVCLCWDTEQPEAADRFRLWVNGCALPFSSIGADVPRYTDLNLFGACLHNMLAYRGPGYYSDVHFIDGLALEADSFGESSPPGDLQWVPREYAGAYGPNGFHLDFDDAADPGRDASGNGNDLAVAGSPLQTLDTPANNYCTINPHATSTTAVSGGNRVGTGVAGSSYYESWPFTFTLGQGKWWFRTALTWTENAAPNFSLYALSEYWDSHGGYYPSNAFHLLRTTEYLLAGEWRPALIPSFNIESGSLLDILLDFDGGAFSVFDDGLLLGTIDISSILGSGPFILAWDDLRNEETGYTAVELDFGATGATPPAGYEDYLPICAANLPDGQLDVLSGAYLGNGTADGPFVWSNCALASVTIGTETYANDGTDGTVRFHAAGFKLVDDAAHNARLTTYPWTATKKSIFKYSNAQEG